MKKQKMLLRGISDAILHVEHYNGGTICGWLSHMRLNQPIKIQSIPQLLFTLGDILSSEDVPVSYHTFSENVLSGDFAAVIRIQVLFREHHTWQGRIVWENQEMEASFRSVLELIEILDEILGE